MVRETSEELHFSPLLVLAIILEWLDKGNDTPGFSSILRQKFYCVVGMVILSQMVTGY